MKTAIVIFGIVIAILTCGLGFVELYFKEKSKIRKRLLIILLICMMVIGILSSVFQCSVNRVDEESVSKKDDTIRTYWREINKQAREIDSMGRLQGSKTDSLLIVNNDLQAQQIQNFEVLKDIYGYTSGGDTNRPILRVQIYPYMDKRDEFIVSFYLYNFGKFPLSNLNYEITDRPTLETEFLQKHNYTLMDLANPDKLQAYAQYFNDNTNRLFKIGTVASLPTKLPTLVHQGFLSLKTLTPSYDFKISWNNQFYRCTYVFLYDSEKSNYELASWAVYDSNNKQVKDFRKYFPLVDETFWKNFDTKRGISTTKNFKRHVVK